MGINEKQAIENAYSYIRLSSKKQTGAERGGEDRQIFRAQEIAAAHGWNLCDQSFQDLGVSSFKGKNRISGNLSKFIEAAKAGKLLKNPVLILESWDRYSRTTLDDAFQSVRELLLVGVSFHVAYGDRTFTKASLDIAEQRVEIERALEAAHNYSAQLSDRVRQAKQRKYKKIAEGGTANISEVAPSWVDWDRSQKVFVRNAKADIVASIFTEYLSGKSIIQICKALNAQGKAFYSKKWNRSSIRYILSSQSVTGVFRGQKIYPELIDETTFKKVRAMLERNKVRRGKRADLVNLFRGIAECAVCGSKVYMSKNKGRNYAYYHCAGSREAGCTNRGGFRADKVEESFFIKVLQMSPDSVLTLDNSAADNLSALKTRKSALEKKKSVLLELVGEFDDNDLKAKVSSILKELETVNQEIAKTEAAVSLKNDAPEALDQIFNSFGYKQYAKHMPRFFKDFLTRNLKPNLQNLEMRNQLQVLIPSIVQKVKLNVKEMKVETVFTNGKSQLIEVE